MAVIGKPLNMGEIRALCLTLLDSRWAWLDQLRAEGLPLESEDLLQELMRVAADGHYQWDAARGRYSTWICRLASFKLSKLIREADRLAKMDRAGRDPIKRIVDTAEWADDDTPLDPILVWLPRVFRAAKRVDRDHAGEIAAAALMDRLGFGPVACCAMLECSEDMCRAMGMRRAPDEDWLGMAQEGYSPCRYRP